MCVDVNDIQDSVGFFFLQLLSEAQAYQQKIAVLEEQEKHLRAQVNHLISLPVHLIMKYILEVLNCF